MRKTILATVVNVGDECIFYTNVFYKDLRIITPISQDLDGMRFTIYETSTLSEIQEQAPWIIDKMVDAKEIEYTPYQPISKDLSSLNLGVDIGDAFHEIRSKIQSLLTTLTTQGVMEDDIISLCCYKVYIEMFHNMENFEQKLNYIKTQVSMIQKSYALYYPDSVAIQ